MDKKWLSACEVYAASANIAVERAVQLSILIWYSNTVGEIPGLDVAKYKVFSTMLEGKKPHKGRFLKSEESKSKKRPKDDATCYPFDLFWEDYGYKVGRKSECSDLWDYLCEDDRETILRFLPEYVRTSSTVEGSVFLRQRAMPTVFIRDRDGKYWKGGTTTPTAISPEDVKMVDEFLAGISTLSITGTSDYPSLINAIKAFKTAVPDYTMSKVKYALSSYGKQNEFSGKLEKILQDPKFKAHYLQCQKNS